MLFFLLGIVTFFNARLLAFGNLLFLAGIVLLIGTQKAVAFFTRPQKIKGTVCFGTGILLILLKWSFVGFAVEFLGILALFGDFFGVILSFLRQIPVIGPILSSPSIPPYLDRGANVQVLPV